MAFEHGKGFVAPFLAHLMSQKSLELVKKEQDMAYGSEGGENLRFKHKQK
jgi:hypothetical protein